MRINIISPKLLADQHLLAEFREIKMLPKAFLRSLHSIKGIKYADISSAYTLNKGHGYFFYNKFTYIENRFQELLSECKNRGFKTDYDKLYLSQIPIRYFHDYTPTHEELLINLDRIELRISDKPSWYKFYGKSVNNWTEFYKDLRKDIV